MGHHFREEEAQVASGYFEGGTGFSGEFQAGYEGEQTSQEILQLHCDGELQAASGSLSLPLLRRLLVDRFGEMP
jgi:hypothetical protein